jgi:hypothetical protein
MKPEQISKAAAAMGKKGGSAKTERKAAAAKANGAKGGRPPIWRKPINLNVTDPPRRFSVTRLDDGMERWAERKPRREVCRDYRLMVWDHQEKSQVTE